MHPLPLRAPLLGVFLLLAAARPSGAQPTIAVLDGTGFFDCQSGPPASGSASRCGQTFTMGSLDVLDELRFQYRGAATTLTVQRFENGRAVGPILHTQAAPARETVGWHRFELPGLRLTSGAQYVAYLDVPPDTRTTFGFAQSDVYGGGAAVGLVTAPELPPDQPWFDTGGDLNLVAQFGTVTTRHIGYTVGTWAYDCPALTSRDLPAICGQTFRAPTGAPTLAQFRFQYVGASLEFALYELIEGDIAGPALFTSAARDRTVMGWETFDLGGLRLDGERTYFASLRSTTLRTFRLGTSRDNRFPDGRLWVASQFTGEPDFPPNADANFEAVFLRDAPVAVVPEPTTVALLGMGLLGLVAGVRGRRPA